MNTKALKVLLIEDNMVNANSVGKMLIQHCDRFLVKSVRTIKDAIDSLEQNNFDVILLDLFLCDSKGINSLDRVQQKAPQLPVVILAEVYDAELAIASLRQGAQDYLIKGEIKGEMLIRSIQYAIERQRIEFNERQQALMNKMIDKIRQSIDLKTILKTTVRQIQQFLNTEEVLIYRCESNRLEDLYVVSSSFNDVTAKATVAQFISTVNPSFLDSSKFRSVCIKATKDIKVNTLPNLPVGNVNSTRCYLSLPIQIDEFEDRSYTNLTHPIIQAEDTSKSSPELWGMLIAYSNKASRKWQNWEISFLQKLTTQVTIAIQQSQICGKLSTANQKLQELAISDGLTGVANRRYFDLVLENEWKRLTREQQPLSLILCDIDHFKAYNDTYGHQQGDRCLQQVSQLLQKYTRRSTDLVARYGGEEFAIILPNTDANGALFIANKIEQQLARQKLPHRKSSVSQYVSCSMGISTMIPNAQQSIINLIKSADSLLYQAKNLGRNQIAVSPQPSYQESNAR